jgi:glycosyltransferase involved in cell wall biosynthesis
MNPEKLALKDTRDSQRNPIRKIGYVGTFNKTKGLDLLLDVFKQLSSFSEYQYELYLVGDGEMRGDAEAFKSSYSSNVKILGYRENPFEWLDDVDFVVIPSRQEGFCLVLIECLLSKKPVVCSDLAPLKEIAGEYSSVTFFEAGDHSDLLRKIEQWYSSADLLSDSEISDIATSVSLRFSKAKMQSEYHKLFSSL